jgi:polysaccharide export outer membrane protein
VAGSLALGALLLPACARLPEPPKQPSAAWVNPEQSYKISPGDTLSVFVWQDPALSVTAHVRPDGRVTMPLVQDVPAAGRTPAELGRDLTDRLKAYVRDPVVTVSVADSAGPLDQQVRIIGQAAKPMSLPYRPQMTLLDALIAVGGLTEFADGNRAVLVRAADGATKRYGVRLADLVQRGDIGANVPLLPGDVLIIPETLF